MNLEELINFYNTYGIPHDYTIVVEAEPCEEYRNLRLSDYGLLEYRLNHEDKTITFESYMY